MPNVRGPLISTDLTVGALSSGVYNAIAPSPQDKQGCALQVDSQGNLLVNVAFGGGGVASSVKILDSNGNPITTVAGSLNVNITGGSTGNAAAGPTGSPVPADADFIGFNLGGILVGVSAANPLPVTFPGSISVTQGTSPWVVSGTVTANAGTGNFTVVQPTGTNLHVVVDSAPSTVVTQGTTPWVDNITQWASTVLGAPTAYGTPPSGNVIGVNAFITNTPAVTIAAGSAVIGHVIVDSGSIVVTQATGTNLHVVVDSGTLTAVTSITNAVTVVQPTGTNLHVVVDSGSSVSATVTGATTDGTTTETPFLVVGGESNDATAQYQPIPLGAGGRSVIVEGIAGGTAIPISGAVSFTAPQHIIVDSGTLTAVTSITNAVTVIQPTGTNLHVVVDSLPPGTNQIGHVITDVGSVTAISSGFGVPIGSACSGVSAALLVEEPFGSPLLDLLTNLLYETRAMRLAVVALVTEGGSYQESDFDPNYLTQTAQFAN